MQTSLEKENIRTIHMRAEVGFFQVEEVLIPKIQSVTEDNSSMQTSKLSPVRISKKDESVSKQLPSKNSKFKE